MGMISKGIGLRRALLEGTATAAVDILTVTAPPSVSDIAEGDDLASRIGGGTYRAAPGWTLTGSTSTAVTLNGAEVAGLPDFGAGDTLGVKETVTATHAGKEATFTQVFTSDPVTVADADTGTGEVVDGGGGIASITLSGAEGFTSDDIDIRSDATGHGFYIVVPEGHQPGIIFCASFIFFTESFRSASS